MEFKYYADLEELGIRLDGLANMALMLSDVATEGPNMVDTYTDSITLLSFLMSEFQEKYSEFMKLVPRKASNANAE